MRKLIFLLALVLAAPLHAQNWPTRPIKVVVPSPPGGPPDLIARMLAPKLQPLLGQPVVVENRAGAGGVVGTAYVAKLPPDGYNWLLTTASHVNTPPFNENVPFDPVRDFTHVTLVAQNFGQALIVPANSPFKSVRELVAYARQNPGKLNYGFAGIGTASHIPAELMKAMGGLDIVGVQYRGVAEAMNDVFAGRMDMFFVGTQLAAAQAKAGKVRVLALTGAKRWKGLPDTPTMDEAGFKGYNTINWFGLWLPAGASTELASEIQSAIVKALADPEIKTQFDAQGLEGVGMPPAEFAKFVEKESLAINQLAKKIKAAKK
jgi:tripartite-type tricarboxylate transporter receptor subunit TctC